VSVWEALIVESPATGVSPTVASNVPSAPTSTPLAATESSTDNVTGEHGAGQNPEPCTVTRSPGIGWAGVIWIWAEAPIAAGIPTTATKAIVAITVATLRPFTIVVASRSRRAPSPQPRRCPYDDCDQADEDDHAPRRPAALALA
jgi:hypothetical protein